MSLQDITITASINSYPTLSYGQKTFIASTDDQSFPIETITGSNGGVWPNFVQGTNYTVNLFVNVTQSWSGSNITPLGIVPYIHNTMEEFIDGEFSGSNYVVSDGSLNDEQCEQFLTVSTVPVAYKVFPFYKNNIQDPANVYLDGNTAPLNGEMYIYYFNFSGGNTRGIYAKIAKIDALGNDNTLSLQELKQFSYTDSTSGKIIFNVLNINEYADYYFYEVTTNITAAVPQDDNYYLHSLSASFTASSLPAAFTYLSSSNGNWTEITDNLNYFNGGKYVFGDTPNIPLQFTSSFKFTVGGTPTDVAFSIIESTPPDSFGSSAISSYIAITSSLNLGAGTYTWLLTGSGFYTSIKNYFASLVYSSDQTITNVTASFIITQSQSPQISTSSFVIEPYLLSNFAGSDCDILLNNYSQNDINNFYRRVLYDNGGVIPSNLQQIISGTAEFAEVTDYLYSARANTLPRYEGVRSESPDVNQPTTFGGYGTLPNVEQNTTYFAYFTNLKANWPIYKNTTSPVIKYLIREDGKVFNPAIDDTSYYNLRGSFEVGKSAYATLLNDTTLVFNNSQSILLSGESYTPILYTISSSDMSIATYSDTINFINLQGSLTPGTNPTNYNFLAYKNSSATLNSLVSQSNVLSNATILYDSSSGYTPGGTIDYPKYEFQNIPQNSVNLNTFARVFLLNPNSTIGLNASFKLELFLENGATTTLLGSDYGYLEATRNDYTPNKVLSITKTNYYPQVGDFIYAIVTYLGGTTNIRVAGGTGIISSNTGIKISTNGLTIPSVVGNFWFTGSANSTTLTSSFPLGAALQGNFKQIDIPSSGFDPIQLPCEIKVGDEIRFEYDESLAYRILEVNNTSSASDDITYLTLDKPVPTVSTLNINHFTVRRKVRDAITGITLDANNILPIYEGFLFPQYPSSTIKRDLPTIINDLSERNLI